MPVSTNIRATATHAYLARHIAQHAKRALPANRRAVWLKRIPAQPLVHLHLPGRFAWSGQDGSEPHLPRCPNKLSLCELLVRWRRAAAVKLGKENAAADQLPAKEPEQNSVCAERGDQRVRGHDDERDHGEHG